MGRIATYVINYCCIMYLYKHTCTSSGEQERWAQAGVGILFLLVVLCEISYVWHADYGMRSIECGFQSTWFGLIVVVIVQWVECSSATLLPVSSGLRPWRCLYLRNTHLCDDLKFFFIFTLDASYPERVPEYIRSTPAPQPTAQQSWWPHVLQTSLTARFTRCIISCVPGIYYTKYIIQSMVTNVLCALYSSSNSIYQVVFSSSTWYVRLRTCHASLFIPMLQ